MDRRRWALLVTGASLFACSSTNSGAPSEDAGADSRDGGFNDVAVSADGPVVDAPSPTTQTVGATGGTIMAPGAELAIPAGALPASTLITVTPSAGPIPSGYTGLSPLFDFAPDGTTLLEPATVVFSLSAPGTTPTVYWSNGSGGFDALATTATATTASAPITHLGSGFVADQLVVSVDASANDASPEAAASDGGDGAAPAQDAGHFDASGGADAADAAGAIEGGVADGSIADSGTVGDGGLLGISVTIDGVPSVFTTNPSVTTNGNSIWTITADDNPSGVHWSVTLVVNGLAQQGACQLLGYPTVTYTHYVNAAPAAVFSTTQAGSSCLFTYIGTPAAHGQYAHGTFQATVVEPADAGGASHALTGGTYNLLY